MAGPFEYFVILAEMRTGSNFLEDNLNALDGVVCHGEAFNPHFVGHKNRRELLGITMQAREDDPLRLLAAMKLQRDVMPGFRFFHDHDPRVLAHVLADPRCAKIILTRNPLESYVSLKIAAQTNQWKLSDLKHQRSARVRFDIDEFEALLSRLQSFQQTLLHGLQTTGQSAFYLAYEDLQDVDVLNGVAQFLGVDARLEALSDNLKKQNPGPLSDKLSNYEQMLEGLTRLDRFDLSRTPNFEPRRGPAVPQYVAANKAPLLYMPIKGGPGAEVETWLAALDEVPVSALQRGFTQKTLRQWKRTHTGHRSFTVVSHPAKRAHAAFCEHILNTGPASYSVIRATLMRAYKVPLPKDAPGPDYTADTHRAAFLAFLKFVKGNLNGQTSIRVDPAWATQDMFIQGMAQFALPDMVMRAERLEEDLALIAGQTGQKSPPLRAVDAGQPFELSDIYDAEIEDAVQDAYQRDYMLFGYGAWA